MQVPLGIHIRELRVPSQHVRLGTARITAINKGVTSTQNHHFWIVIRVRTCGF